MHISVSCVYDTNEAWRVVCVNRLLLVALVLTIFVSSVSAGWGDLTAACVGSGSFAPGGTINLGATFSNSNTAQGGGVQFTSVSINVPSYVATSSPTSRTLNTIVCYSGDSGCFSRNSGAVSTSTTTSFSSLSIDPNTPAGQYSYSITISGYNEACAWNGCSFESQLRTSVATCSFTISGATSNQQNAQNAISSAASAISQAQNANSAASSEVTQAGSTCTQAQSSWTQGQTDLSTATSKKSSADSYYSSGSYQSAISDANAAQNAASSAKSSFNAAKSAAESCISNAAQQAAALEQAKQTAQRSIAQAEDNYNSTETFLIGEGSEGTGSVVATAYTNTMNMQCISTTEALSEFKTAVETMDTAQSKLENDARGAFSQGDYQNAQILANSANDLINQARSHGQKALDLINDATAKAGAAVSDVNNATQALNRARTLLIVSGQINVNSPDASTLISASEDYYTLANSSCGSGDYSGASSNALLAKSKATSGADTLEPLVTSRLEQSLNNTNSILSAQETLVNNLNLRFSSAALKTMASTTENYIQKKDFANALTSYQNYSTEVGKTKDEISKILKVNDDLTSVSNLANQYKQELTTTPVTLDLNTATENCLSKLDYNCTDDYIIQAKNELANIQNSLNEKKTKIDQALGAIADAENTVNETSTKSTLIASPDLSKVKADLLTAQSLAYSNPDKALTMASSAKNAAISEGKRVDGSQFYIYAGTGIIILIGMVAIGGILLLRHIQKQPKKEKSEEKPIEKPKEEVKEERDYKHCIHCGAAIKPHAKFCPKCGNSQD
ncbi:Uncharacterised protein [Candidatus Gugararchaeum adminiculabundum]|nr:Uncharacterised protein [Candidatus Gugararchaeum adminiculabundum]